MSKADRIIKASLNRPNVPQLVTHHKTWLENKESEVLRLERSHKMYVEGDEAWFVPEDSDALFIVKCFIIESIRDNSTRQYVLDEPLHDPVQAIALHSDITSAIDALERRWLQRVCAATTQQLPVFGIILPETKLVLSEEKMPEILSVDLNTWRSRLLMRFGEILDLTMEDLFPKMLGEDWFKAQNFFLLRQNNDMH